MIRLLVFAVTLATIVIAGAVAIYFGVGLALTRKRLWCPSCRRKNLKMINYFRCNPPPNYAFFVCEDCETEFVQVYWIHGVEHPMIPRAGSPWEHHSGWESPDPVKSSSPS
jgi:hypothetical protein